MIYQNNDALNYTGMSNDENYFPLSKTMSTNDQEPEVKSRYDDDNKTEIKSRY